MPLLDPSQAATAGGAPAKASAYDLARSTPTDAETTPSKKVVVNPDGSRTAIVSPKPTRFQDAVGWHGIDLTRRGHTHLQVPLWRNLATSPRWRRRRAEWRL